MKKLYTLFLLNVLWVTAQNPTCENSQFYGIGGNHSIYSFTKSISSITYNGVYVNSAPGGSLAIADLGNGSRFYTNSFDFTTGIGKILEYDGTTWNTVYTGPQSFQNAGGNGNYLYFHTIKSSISINEIVRFDGTSLTTIWSDQTNFQPCADISVDSHGNVYFFTGVTQFDVNQLNIVSPNGIMLAQIPINFEGFTGYGSCFLKDVFHIAFQGSNSQFPNKLVPITIIGSTATIGTPIAVPQPVIGTSSSGQILLAMSDLASCASANITLSNANFELDADFNVYANANQLTVNSKHNGKAVIFNSIGQKVTDFEVYENIESINDISNYANGIYFVNFNFDGKTAVKKFLKH